MERLDLTALPSPCYVVDRRAIERNLQVIDQVRKRSGAKVLLALKSFALWRLFEMMRPSLDGVSASSLNEAKLGRDEFGGQVHVYAPAYRDDEFDQLVELADTVIFNSQSQWHRFRDRAAGRRCGLRINPQFSQARAAKYDPCLPGCRLGVTADELDAGALDGISGLHFHTLCESGADALVETLDIVEAKFGPLLGRMSWTNFGGGHHITADGYDVDALVAAVTAFADRYHHEVYLEPGEAVVLDAGIFVATVLDIVHNEVTTAVLDTSATAHLPDVLEMPYRPGVVGGGLPGEKKHTYRLGGMTCLAGDVIGDYSFDRQLQCGDRIVFEDMAHYTMVKNTNFNGVNLPTIVIHDSATGRTEVVRTFTHDDYRNRLA